MIYLCLFFEFFQIGLFSIGGGLATLPFLTNLGNRTGWFTAEDLANMVAISESTPGPMGINTATYVGFHIGGIPGGVIAVLGLITPSIAIILIISLFLRCFRQNKLVDGLFYGLRPASIGLICAALLQVCSISLLFRQIPQPGLEVVKVELFHLPAILLAASVFFSMREKHLKQLHPIIFIALSAIAGILFQM